MSKIEQRRDGNGPTAFPSPPLIGIYR